MKEQILEISDKLKSNNITENEAKTFLLFLFGVIKRYTLETYSPIYRRGYEWYIVDNKTNIILENYTSKETKIGINRVLELNAL